MYYCNSLPLALLFDASKSAQFNVDSCIFFISLSSFFVIEYVLMCTWNSIVGLSIACNLALFMICTIFWFLELLLCWETPAHRYIHQPVKLQSYIHYLISIVDAAVAATVVAAVVALYHTFNHTSKKHISIAAFPIWFFQRFFFSLSQNYVIRLSCFLIRKQRNMFWISASKLLH